jgi:hypothetical protein
MKQIPDFDPGWTHDEALAAGPEAYKKWSASSMLEAYEASWREGDAEVVIRALTLCAKNGFPLPPWLAGSVCEAIRKWSFYEAGTLDEALGVGRPKNTRMNSRKKAIKLSTDVPVLVMRYQKQGYKMDNALFEMVGKELNVSASTARDSYYESSYYKYLVKSPKN